MPSLLQSPSPPAITVTAPSMISTACDGVRHVAYLGSYPAAKKPLGSMEPLPLLVHKDPLRQSICGF